MRRLSRCVLLPRGEGYLTGQGPAPHPFAVGSQLALPSPPSSLPYTFIEPLWLPLLLRPSHRRLSNLKEATDW